MTSLWKRLLPHLRMPRAKYAGPERSVSTTNGIWWPFAKLTVISVTTHLDVCWSLRTWEAPALAWYGDDSGNRPSAGLSEDGERRDIDAAHRFAAKTIRL